MCVLVTDLTGRKVLKKGSDVNRIANIVHSVTATVVTR